MHKWVQEKWEIWIKLVAFINVNILVMILSYRFENIAIGGNWINYTLDLSIIFYNCMWIYNMLKIFFKLKKSLCSVFNPGLQVWLKSRKTVNVIHYSKRLKGKDSYQTTNGIFHRTRTKNFTICMETQKTPNSQSNLEKEKWNRRNQSPWLRTILQSYSHQDSMVLAQKQKYRSMEQDRKPRDKPTHIWSPYLW